MAKYIDVDAMHKFVEDKVAEGKDGWANGVGYEWAWTLTAVDMFPAADVAPVVHGSWEVEIDNDEFWGELEYWKCSQCGTRELRCDRSNYCPNCGARMNGGNHETD